MNTSQTKPVAQKPMNAGVATGNQAAASAANPNSIWQGKVDISLDNLSPYSKGAKQTNPNSVPLKAMMSQPSSVTTPPTSMVSPLGQSKAPSFFPSQQPLSPTGGTSNYNISTASMSAKPTSTGANVPFTPFQNELNQFKSLNFDMNKK